MRDCMKEARDLLLARIQCIWIQTYEEQDAVMDLKEMLRSDDEHFREMRMFVWSQTAGLAEMPRQEYETAEPPDMRINSGVALLNKRKKMIQGGEFRSSIWVLRDLHSEINDAKVQRLIRDYAEYPGGQTYNPIIVISPSSTIPEDIAHLFRIVEYGLPDEEMIKEGIVEANGKLERAAAKDAGGDYRVSTPDEIDRLTKACMGMTRYEESMALRESMVKYHRIDLDFLSMNKIQMVKKTGVLDYKVPHVGLDDIGGNTVIKEWLRKKMDAFSDDAREFGIRKPKGYCAVGVPGSGKSIMAEALAFEMHVPLLSLNMAKIMDKMVGASEKKIDHALKVAKACAPCVLLLDEVEKSMGGAQSSNVSDSGITQRVLGAILSFMNDNDSGVYVIMTSNDISQLPPEFTRKGRIDGIWYFGLPSDEERKAIFRIHFGKVKRDVPDEIIDIAVAHSKDFTGAEIEGCVQDMLVSAYERCKETGENAVTAEDVIAACAGTVPVARSSREKINALERYCRSHFNMASEVPAADNRNEKKDDFDFSLDL